LGGLAQICMEWDLKEGAACGCGVKARWSVVRSQKQPLLLMR